MKKSVLFATVLSAAGVLLAVPAQADDKLAMAKGCMACHKVDAKLVGPAYNDVGKCYDFAEGADRAGCPEGTDKLKDKDVVAELSAKVKAGGSGVWGPIPMPPNAAVSDEDIKTLVEWVISHKAEAAAAAEPAAPETPATPAK
jgi:cytochrome c